MRILGALLLLALLSACATTSRERIELPEISSWEARKAVLSELSEWEFRGRIGVKAGDDGFNGKLRWIQNGDDFTATVGGPIGIGTVRIAGNSESVTLTDKDGVETALLDVEQELMLRYGWTIPVRSLRYWALGIPDPHDAAETVVNNSDELEKLVQRGWIVSISRYKDIGGQSMPSRLLVEGNATRVRLIVDSWYFFK